ncbi:unnamed protein product [Withania somnifera]
MEIDFAVGGAFLSSALSVLFDRLSPHGDLLKMFQRYTNDVRLLKKLRMTLLGLQAWLNELRDALDSAENLMEEVNYEALRLKVEGQHQTLSGTSNQQVSDLNLWLSDDFLLNIKEKLKETPETLEVLEKQIGRLGLKGNFGSTKQETRSPATSLVDESDVLGRQNEIKDLINRLLSEDANGENLTVVPIVGMGGVKDHFNLKAWVCVAEPYDALRITKGLLQEIGSLKGKKYLIVLDDVLNEDYQKWDDLRNIFALGGMGSKIIVTIRKERVASMMGCGAISVGTLSSEVSWALFKRHSLENRYPDEHPELEEIGKQIEDKCKGLPLALKALAGILRSKSDVDEWRDILRSKIWELPSCSNGILPALMLSYNDLPAHLKQCFAYCAIYPKDYPFCKDQVIHLWIANGLAQQLHSGNLYFLELRSRTLFERVRQSSKRDVEKFLMHDLVNDLAQVVSSNLSTLQIEKLINLHHLDISNTSRLKIPLQLSNLKSLKVIVGTKFLLGDLRMEDLSELHNLYGSLSILELQNVVDRKEALKAKMREKNHVEMLSLEWSERIADNSQTERDILDELQPHTNIKELEITRYRGTQFPNWLDDHSFKLLVQLSLSNCKDCYALPALGQLSSLKFLSITEMHGITEVAEEFYGKMPEWKQWHVLGNGEFPTLQNLSIKNCRKLMGRLPENLCSLTELTISNCTEINLEKRIQLSSLKKFVVTVHLKFSYWWKKVFPRLFLSYGYLTSIHYRAKVFGTSLPFKVCTFPPAINSNPLQN